MTSNWFDDRWDYPDPRHDPDPMRLMSPEARERDAAETARRLALIAAWSGVPEPLRQRAIARWFSRQREG
jgi:hypothetical protein